MLNTITFTKIDVNNTVMFGATEEINFYVI